MNKTDKNEAELLLREWQRRLNLGDWAIRIEPDCLPDDMGLENVAGEAEWVEVNRSAVIRIINPELYGERIIPFDFEKTLVHELLHLKFCLLESDDELRNRVIHMLIEDMARALVITKREAGETGG